MRALLPYFHRLGPAIVVATLVAVMISAPTQALIPPPGPSSGSVGLEGTISTAPPKQGASITTPGNGASFTSVPITVNGLCPKGLLIKLFSNNVFVGSTQCDTGSYSLQADLFSGQNELVARVYDALDQAGPDSNTVSVTFNDAQFIQFGSRVSLSSIYAKRGANPGDVLDWPILLSGGSGPYAFSIDWGDGTPTDLQSQPFAGNISIKHSYKQAGVYKIIVKATDANGTEAFLQLVGVGNGKVTQSNGSGTNTSTLGIRTKVIWWPALFLPPMIIATFWVGRRHELYTLRKQLEKSRGANKS